MPDATRLHPRNPRLLLPFTPRLPLPAIRGDYRPAAARASATSSAPVRGVRPRALVFTCTAAVTPCSAKCMTSVV